MLEGTVPTTQRDPAAHRAAMPVADLLYEGEYRRTAQVDYGVSLDALLSGQAQPPAAGVRIDIYFEGPVRGKKLNGYLKGVDYLLVRADGRCDLNMHARIATDDGAHIAFWADGIFAVPDDSGIAQIRENVRLTTADARYEWVNKLQVWITGTIALAEEKIFVQAYVA